MTTKPKAGEANSAPSPEDSDGDDDDFDTAFAEFAGASNDDPDPSGNAGGDGDGEEAQPNNGNGADDPATRPDADQGKGKPAPAARQENEPSATDRELERLREFERTANGRLSALQRQLNEANAQQARSNQDRAQQRPAPSKTAPPSAKPAPSNADPFETDEELKAFAKDYPELVPVFRKVAEPLRTEVSRLNSELSQYSQQHRSQVYENNREAVLYQHPDFDEAIRSKEFADWFNAAPGYVRAGIERNGTNIVDPNEVAHLTGQFKAETGWRASQNPDQQQQPTRDQTLRDRRLRAAPETRDAGPPRASGVPDDFDAAFNHYANQKRAG